MPSIWLAPPELWHGDVNLPDCSFCRIDETSCGPEVMGVHVNAPCTTHVSNDVHNEVDPDLAGKCLMLVLVGSCGRRRLLSSMKSAGVRLVCYAPVKAEWASKYIHDQDWILGPPTDAEAAQRAVEAWLSTDPSRHIDGLLCYDEYGLQLAARLRQALTIPGPWCSTPPSVIEVVRSKRLFRDACVAGGVPAPRYAHITAPTTKDRPDQVARLAEAGITFPVVAKPSGCAGSFSVMRADDMSQLAAVTSAYYDALPAYLEQLQLGATSTCATGGMVVEELITGQEVDVDCVVMEGVLLFACVSDNHPCKQVDGVAAFVETGGCCPSVLPDHAQAKLVELAAHVVGLFGPALSGVLHFEAKYDLDSGVAMPIELNARIGGAETWTNVRAAWGLDLARAAARIACGLRPIMPPHLLQQLQGSTVAVTTTTDHHYLSIPDPAPVTAASCALTINTGPSVMHTTSTMASSITNTSTPITASSSGSHLSRVGLPCSCHHLDTAPPPDTAAVAAAPAASPSPAEAEGQGEGCSCQRAARDKAAKQANLAAEVQGASTECPRGPSSLDVPMLTGAATALGFDYGFTRTSDTNIPSPMTCECGCTGTCCCCVGSYWDFLSARFGSKAPALSEPCAFAGCTDPHREQGYNVLVHAHGGAALTAQDSSVCEAFETHSEAADTPSAAAPSPVTPSWVRHMAPATYVASVNFVPDWTGEGRLEEFEVSGATLSDPAYIDSEKYYSVGATVKLPPAGFSALGWMVTSGASHDEAVATMADLMQGVNIRLSNP